MLGRNIALALGAAVAAAGRAIGRAKTLALPDEHLEDLLNHSRGKGKGGPNHLAALHRRIWKQGRPDARRHWHDPRDDRQQRAIIDAQAKRHRKAKKLTDDLNASIAWNRAHCADHTQQVPYGSNYVWHRLNPFYVNREA